MCDGARQGCRCPVEKRFWGRVDTAPGQGPSGDCWEWQGDRSSKGYGRLKETIEPRRTRRVMATAIALRVAGRELQPGQCALHRCDNPPCVRPDHLFIGTKGDNNRDRTAKGRGIKGERVNTCKLTEEQVAEIRALYATGEYSQPHLGRLFGVRHGTIGYIVRGETWKH